MTVLRAQGYGSRPPVPAPSIATASGPRHAAALALLAAVLLAGCGAEPQSDPAPLDRFTWPTGLAVSGDRLYVVSTNFDLRYAAARGGSVLRTSPLATLSGATPTAPTVEAGGARMGSFAGEVALVEPGTCGLAAGASPVAFVASRTDKQLYKFTSGASGLACGSGDAFPGAACTTRFADPQLIDPYGVAVTCSASGRNRVWVGFLRTPSAQSLIATIDLDAATPTVTVGSVGAGAIRSFAYEREADRLFFTAINTGLSATLRWYDLSPDCEIDLAESQGGCVTRGTDLWQYVRGAELSSIALSNALPGLPRRLYVTARVYDPDLAATLGYRPGYDVAGVLLVLEEDVAPNGDLRLRWVRTLDVGLGAAEVKVLPPRGGGLRDLVAITATEDGMVWIYDDETGAMRDVFGRDQVTGAPRAGREPFALAVQDLGTGVARVYVASFIDNFVSAIDVPLTGAAAAAFVADATTGAPIRIGQVTP